MSLNVNAVPLNGGVNDDDPYKSTFRVNMSAFIRPQQSCDDVNNISL